MESKYNYFVYSSGINIYQVNFNKIIYVFQTNKTKEQPVLLDPFLPNIMKRIFALLKRTNLDELNETQMKVILQVSLFLGKISHVRGRKKLEKYFPHEVPDLRFVLRLVQVIEAEKTKASNDEGIYKISAQIKLHEPQVIHLIIKF